MLVLKRKLDERVFVVVNGVEVVVQITAVYPDSWQVSIGIEAPKEVGIWREEIYHGARKSDIATTAKAT